MKLKIAVATKGENGLEDWVSEVFGRTKTITVIEMDDSKVNEVKTFDNPALSYKYGAGPILVKTLQDLGVNVVVASNFGPSVSEMLDGIGYRKFVVKAGTPVKDAIDYVRSNILNPKED